MMVAVHDHKGSRQQLGWFTVLFESNITGVILAGERPKNLSDRKEALGFSNITGDIS